MNETRLRPRILYLVDALDHDYQSGVTHGVVRTAQKSNADIMILVGGQMLLANHHLNDRKFIYNLAKPQDFDGVILLATSISSQEGHAAIAPLIIRFASLPMVSIGLDIGKGSTVLVDNKEGMTTITEHLIEAHGYKQFAYISGPENNRESRIRLNAFRETLAKNHLRMPDDRLVAGTFTEKSGEEAVKELIDERKVDITALDAIVAANDSMAVGAMDVLNRRGIQVPSDIAVVGFDDIEAARYADTPLTTIQQPLILQGKRAVEKILASLESNSPETISVRPKLVIRRSCGCGTPLETPVLNTSPPSDPDETLDKIIARKRVRIENDLATVAERGGVARGWESELMDAVIEAAAGKGYRRVTQIVGDLVRKSIETGEGGHVWATTIAALDKHLMQFVSPGSEESARIEAILHRSLVTMSKAVEHFHATKVRKLRNQTTAFSEATIAMLTTLDSNSLISAAAAHLPKLGIKTCAISLFDNYSPKASTMDRFLILDDAKQLETPQQFPTSSIVPPELIENRPHALVVEPLCYFDEKFGVAAFEYGPIEGNVYEHLGAFFSAAIKAIATTQASAKAEKKTDARSHIDALTGIYNRNHLSYRFAEEFGRAEETGQPFSLILLDMDDFKTLNEELGDDQGDQALIGIAETINRCTRSAQVVFRLEEDTFAVLLPDSTAEQAKSTAELIKRRLKLALAFTYFGHIAASFGVATVTPPNLSDVQDLTESASRALAVSKHSGKDRVTHANDLDH